ncbi:hypothetical protein Tco_0409661 [Tanacetum coccineum]
MHLPVVLTDARKSSIKKVLKGTLKDDDDDFVLDAPKQQAAPKKHQPMTRKQDIHTGRKKESVKNQNYKSNGFMSSTSRQCPVKLFNVVKTLSNAQKKDVREIGFTSILKLDIEVNPLKLGYWVVDRLNTDSLCLEIDNETSLQITRQSVHDIFGFPRGILMLKLQGLIYATTSQGSGVDNIHQHQKGRSKEFT